MKRNKNFKAISLTCFTQKNGIYATQLEVVTMSSIDWWSTYGFKTLELAKLAEKYYLNQ